MGVGEEPEPDGANNDWRDVDRQLQELPDDKLYRALQNAGVKAVLPSHKKPRGPKKRPGQRGEATQRWAVGDWMERVDMQGLPEARKFLRDPAKPPTQSHPVGSENTPLTANGPLATQAPPKGWTGVLWGALAAALLIGGGLWFWQAQDEGGAALAIASGPPETEAKPPPPAPALVRAAAEKQNQEAPGEPGALAPRYAIADDALPALRKAAHGGDVEAMVKMARARMERDMPGKAVRWAKLAYRTDPTHIEARVVLGDAFQLLGDDVMAERTWRRALARVPNHKGLKRRLGLE